MSEMRQTTDAPYERRDVNIRWVIITALIALVAIPASLLLAWWVLQLGTGVSGARLPLFPAAPAPPQPRLQIAPQQDLDAFMAEKRQWLTSYGWVDQEQGLAHVPLEVAIEHVLEEGLPRWTSPDTHEPGMTAHRARERALQAELQAEDGDGP